MDLLIECRPPRDFVEALSKAGLESLAGLFRDLVLFVRHISCSGGPGRNDIELLVDEVFSDTVKALPSSIRITLDRIEVRDSSIIVTIFVAVVVLPHVGGAVAGASAAAAPVAGGLAAGHFVAWAAGAFAGGALAEIGKVFAKNTLEKIQHWWHKKGEQPPPIIVIDPQVIAEQIALSVASQHGCTPALQTGGSRFGEHFYQYTYQLYNCARKVLIVSVDAQGKDPPMISVQ